MCEVELPKIYKKVQSYKSMQPSNVLVEVAAKNMTEEIVGKYEDIAGKNHCQSTIGDGTEESKVKSEKVLQESNDKANGITVSIPKGEVSKEQLAVKLQKELPPVPPHKRPLKKPKLEDPYKIQAKFCPKFKLVEVVKELLASSAALHHPSFKFKVTPEAAYHNFQLLKKRKFNLDKALKCEKATSITLYGSEFKTVPELEKLFKFHPRWKQLKQRLLEGSKWKLKYLPEEI